MAYFLPDEVNACFSLLNVDVGGAKGSDKAKGWKNLDIGRNSDFVHDLNSGMPFPFRDEEVGNFYCSHTLEHVKPWLVQFVVDEFYRCLRHGGMARIVVPDVGLAMKWYVTDPGALVNKRHPSRPAFYPELPMALVLSWLFTATGRRKADGHYMGFDWRLLKHYFVRAGFCKVGKLTYGECAPVFARKDKVRYKDFSLFMQAKK